jgi:hypothetical protein
MEKIIQQKISADHLLYSSLKYTKTTDVILNLLFRWRNLIDEGVEKMLEKAKKMKKLKSIPTAPKLRIEKIQELAIRNDIVLKTIDLYKFLRQAETAEKVRENEFRKNVALRIMYMGNWQVVDLEKLKEFNVIIENFVNYLRTLS